MDCQALVLVGSLNHISILAEAIARGDVVVLEMDLQGLINLVIRYLMVLVARVTMSSEIYLMASTVVSAMVLEIP